MAKRAIPKERSALKKTSVRKTSVKGQSGKKAAVKSRKPTAFLQIDGQQWPLERNVLFRPERLQYVRKLLPDQGCVFCHCAGQEPRLETLCVYQTQFSMVVLNKYPYNSGHLLVLPKRHCGDLEGLSDAEYLDLMSLVRRTCGVVKAVYQPGGLNVGMNQGRVAGAGIPDHLHWHIIPRWAGDLNFFPLIAETKVVIENLESSFDRLRESFQNEDQAAKR